MIVLLVHRRRWIDERQLLVWLVVFVVVAVEQRIERKMMLAASYAKDKKD